MDRLRVSVYIFLTLCFSFSLVQGSETGILFSTVDLGSDRWQYTYEVSNISLVEEINEFTIRFDYGLYDNLAIETSAPLSDDWNEVVMQTEPAIMDDGGYDALELTGGIGVGQTVSGFSVSFDWLGTGAPGEQYYEIIDPETFAVINTGLTVPEPASMLLWGLVGIGILRRKARS